MSRRSNVVAEADSLRSFSASLPPPLKLRRDLAEVRQLKRSGRTKAGGQASQRVETLRRLPRRSGDRRPSLATDENRASSLLNRIALEASREVYLSAMQDARHRDDTLIRVQADWAAWQSAEVPIDDIQSLYWFRPGGAPQALLHGRVSCASIVGGDIPHDCNPATAPHRLLVCVLRRHALPSAYLELVRRAYAERIPVRNRPARSTR